MESNVTFENVITLIQHEHPLHLVDLQPCYPDYREFSDDEEEDKVIKWEFNSPCSQCGKDINVYHRYYYKCTDSSCNYVLHKSCGKPLPETLILKSHSLTHTYTLHQGPVRGYYKSCHICSDEVNDNWYYHCSLCSWYSSFKGVHVKCAMKERVENHIIYHPSHSHPLDTVISQSILCKCDACGKKHEGIFYRCTTCFDHTIHTDCAFLPRKLHIIQHTHPLIISYSSEYIDRTYYFGSYVGSTCRICRALFGPDHLWIYKCEGCRYFVHLDCATSRNEPFMSILLSADIGKTIKNFKDADHPGLLKLPFPDQTYSILKHCLSKESGSTTGETSQRNLNNHICHQHVLSLVSTQPNDSKGTTSSSVSSISCHDPMKRIELLCNGCVRPIMDVPFYKCEDERCDFVLHEWCTRLPVELPNYQGHPKHTLVFVSKVPRNSFGIFICKNCSSFCNGFAYGCTECDYYIDVNCGFIPEEITHEAHPDHILSRCDERSMRKPCVAEGGKYYGSRFSYSCRSCDFYLHSACALFLPRIINHKLDKHPMKLTYGPVENHKSEYFCEVCEEELNPNLWFYHCHECAYSLHTRCAPLIVNFEAAIPEYYRSVYYYLNIKFGGSYNIKGHEHSVSLAVGSDADGKCTICDRNMSKFIIVKCLKCKLHAMHWKCCLRL